MTATNIRVAPKFEENAKKKVHYKLNQRGKALIATLAIGLMVMGFGSKMVDANHLNKGIESLRYVEVDPNALANDLASGNVYVNGNYLKIEMNTLEFVNTFKECVNLLEQAKELNFETDKVQYNKVEFVDEFVSQYFNDGIPNVGAISELINGENQNLTAFASILPHLRNWTYDAANVYKNEMLQASKRTVIDIINKALGTNFDGNEITLMNRDVTDASEYYIISTDKYGIEERFFLGDNLDMVYGKFYSLVNDVHDSNPKSVNELREVIAQSNALNNTAKAITMATDIDKLKEGREPRAKDKAVINAIEEIQESSGMEEPSKGRGK